MKFKINFLCLFKYFTELSLNFVTFFQRYEMMPLCIEKFINYYFNQTPQHAIKWHDGSMALSIYQLYHNVNKEFNLLPGRTKRLPNVYLSINKLFRLPNFRRTCSGSNNCSKCLQCNFLNLQFGSFDGIIIIIKFTSFLQ